MTLPGDAFETSSDPLGSAGDAVAVLDPPDRGSPLESESADLIVAEAEEPIRLPPFPVPWRHPIRCAGWLIRTTFGLVSMALFLAVIAAIPLVNFLALGFLLDAEGRVARSGRWRDGLPLIHLAPRLGSIALGTWLWCLPLRYLAGMTSDAALIEPDGAAFRHLRLGSRIAWAVITLHLCLALARGGSLGCFFRPIKNIRWLRQRLKSGDYWQVAGQKSRAFIKQFDVWKNFKLGVRGFAAAFVWLFIPTLLYAALRELKPGPGIVTVLGGLLLVWVFAWVPFLQARVAAENRWRAGLQLREVRKLFDYAPWAWLLAVIGVYVLSLPLYLTKVVLPPADAMWVLTLVFIASIYPARLLTGWAYHRAVARRELGLRSWLTTRLLVKLLMLPLLGIYVFILFFTQFISEHGKQALFEHHALLLPWPG